MTDMFIGEEDFVLPPSRFPPAPSSTASKPYKLHGWADVQPAPRAPSPVNKPVGCLTLRQHVRQEIEGMREARQKAPGALGRVAQKMSAVKQRLVDALRGGFQRVGGFFGKRKRVADVASEANDTPIQAKRGRFDDGNEAPADLEVHEEGHLEGEEAHGIMFDVPAPDFDGYPDLRYGRAEDQAATEVVLEAGPVEDGAVVEDVPMEEVGEAPAAINAAPAEVNGAPQPIPQALLDAIISAAANAAATAVGGDIAVLDAAMAAAKVAANQVIQAAGPQVIAPIPDDVDIPAPDDLEEEAVAAPVVRREVPRRRRQPRAQPAPANRRRKAPAAQPTVVMADRGHGFTARILSNGTAAISGVFPGVDWKSSTLFRDAAKGHAIIKAPEGHRIVTMSMGYAHIMFLTDKKKLMIVGSNKFGQLGIKTTRPSLFRAANQTPNNVHRGPFNTAHLKFKTIYAVGNQSWAWTTDGVAYRCGANRDPASAKAVMTLQPNWNGKYHYGSRSV